jgi:hypothetical protein
MANEVIGIDVQVKLEQLRAQLATLGPGMDKEAKAMTAALAKEVKKQTAEMQKLSASAATATGSFSKLSGTVSKTAQVSGALGGVVAKLNPELGTAVTTVGSLTGVMEGLKGAGVLSTAMLGPLAAAVVLLGGAYYYFSSELEKAEAAQEKMSQAATRAQKAHGDLEKVVQDVTDAYEVSVGITDEAAVSQRKSIEKVNAAFSEEAEAIKASALEAGSMTMALQSLEAKRRGTIALIEETTEVEKEGIRLAKEKEAAQKAAAAASREAAKAAKDAADTAAQYDRDEQARLDDKSNDLHDQTWRDAREKVAAAGEAYDKLVKMYQDEAEVKETLRQADAASARQAAQDAKDREAAMFDVASATLGAIESIVSGALSSATAAAEQAADTAINHLNRIRDLRDQLTMDEVDAASLSGDALVRAYKRGEVAASDLSDAQKASIDDVLKAQEKTANRRAKIEKRAAREAFKVEQGAALSAAVMGAALAVIQALSTLGPIAGPAAAIAISAATAAEIATIAAQKPSFHRGGLVEERGRGEVSATLLPGESVLNRQATSSLGAGGVAALNNGGGGGGSVSLRIGRLEAREIIRTDVASGGLVVQAARSAAAKGGNLAGRSGRRPIG